MCLMATRISSSNDSSGVRFLQNTAEQKCWNEKWKPDSMTWEPDLCRYTHSMWSPYMLCWTPYMLCWTHKPHTQDAWLHPCNLGTRLQHTCATNTQIFGAQSQETVERGEEWIKEMSTFYSSLQSIEESLSKTICTPTSNVTKSA